MGSDLHMNPPQPDCYRSKWEGDTLIIERLRDAIYQDGGKWREVWRGSKEITMMDETKLLFKAFGFEPPPHPDSELAIEQYNYAEVHDAMNRAIQAVVAEFTNNFPVPGTRYDESGKKFKQRNGRIKNAAIAKQRLATVFKANLD